MIEKSATEAIHYTYYNIHKSIPRAAIFGRDMLVNIPYMADTGMILDIIDFRWKVSTNATKQTPFIHIRDLAL